jgi:glycosyltransferase involved in cell wall biosynthesis
MKIAILGARGIPANYGGFDTLVEELSVKLANNYSFDVTVYCRSNYYQKRQEFCSNVRCFYIFAWRVKGLESLLHTFLSALHAITKRFDVIFIVDPANAPIGIFLKLSGQKVVIHTDGLGWKRRKWGRLSRKYYKWVEFRCAKYIKAIVTDNPVMKEYYLQNYKRDSVCIAYGAENL